MPRGTRNPPSQFLAELLDRLMDAYVEWREECVCLEEAWARWNDVPPAEKELAYAAFRAALDREERACAVYPDLIESVQRAVDSPRNGAAWEAFSKWQQGKLLKFSRAVAFDIPWRASGQVVAGGAASA